MLKTVSGQAVVHNIQTGVVLEEGQIKSGNIIKRHPVPLDLTVLTSLKVKFLDIVLHNILGTKRERLYSF